MSIALQLILSALIAAFGRLGLKLVTPEFIDRTLSAVIIWALEKIAPMTSNSLDDEIVEEVKKRLTAP